MYFPLITVFNYICRKHAMLQIRIRDSVLFWPRDPGWKKIRIWDPG
jgi:hypothetical protein